MYFCSNSNTNCYYMKQQNIKSYFLILLIFLTGITLFSFKSKKNKDSSHKPEFILEHDKWVDSVYNSLSFEEKIAQLFMVAAYSNKGSAHIKMVAELISEMKIGGLIFFQGGPVRQAKLTNYYQSMSQTPLMISMDAEWGLGMRLDSTITYPKQLMLGAISDNELIYEMGEQIALQLKRLGVHINFAPIIDLNNNPDNPVINYRSFGESKENVTRKGYAYMLGLQDNNILAIGKHFPGHGDTDSDSHKTLPVITHNKAHLDEFELFPFRELINQGIGGIMVAHLFIPSLYSAENKPSTLSENVVTGLLKEELDFEGLIFTDALNMQGVRKYYEPGEINIEALKAGNDVLLIPESIGNSIKRIVIAVEKGYINKEQIEYSCKKILYAKKWFGLDDYKAVNIKNLSEDLNDIEAKKNNIELVENSITLLKNSSNLLPLKKLDTLKIASVAIGNGKHKIFQNYLGNYTNIDFISINKNVPTNEFDSILTRLSKYNFIVVSFHNTNQRPANDFGITANSISFVEKLSKKTTVSLDLFANPYAFNKFDDIDAIQSIIISYEDSKLSQALSAQVIFGGIKVSGTLPVSLNKFKIGTGIQIKETIRLKYTDPEDLCIDPNLLIKVDSLALNSIKEGATPGCQILCAKDGKVFYQKSFGFHTYDSLIEVKNKDVYDIASITKITATVSSLMKLYDEQKLLTDDLLSEHLCYLDTSNKKKIKIDDVLIHQAALQAWIPFYINTIDSLADSTIYSLIYSNQYSLHVADNLYIRNDYSNSLIDTIIASPLRDTIEYKYSDLGFYLFKEMIEQITDKTIDEYVDSVFFSPLGIHFFGYQPIHKIDTFFIVPTEYDTVFRNQLLRGYVHDQGAAMLGGVGGHAGMFSNSNDLAVFMQMLLQKGNYGGQQFLNPETVELFTTTPSTNLENRRALGFDKPEMDYNKEGPTCHCVSAKSFGHSGFTGTIAWADPETNIIYIFLSNRIYPNQDNAKLVEMNVRTEIQQAFADAIFW